MENTIKVAKKPMTAQAKERRRNAITLIEEQLKMGTKPPKKGVSYSEEEVVQRREKENGLGGILFVKLSQADILKKQKELTILKTRI